MIINKIFRNMNTQIRRTWSNLTQIQNKTQIKQDKSIGNKRAQSTNRSRNIKIRTTPLIIFQENIKKKLRNLGHVKSKKNIHITYVEPNK